jgi:hypothetical protein
MDWTTLPPPDGGTTSADEQIDAEAAPAETPGA